MLSCPKVKDTCIARYIRFRLAHCVYPAWSSTNQTCEKKILNEDGKHGVFRLGIKACEPCSQKYEDHVKNGMIQGQFLVSHHLHLSYSQ